MTNEILRKIAEQDHLKVINDEDRYKIAQNQSVNLVGNTKIAYYKILNRN